MKKIILMLFTMAASLPILAAETVTEHAPELSGASLSPLWALPFLGMILSIAVFPLILPDFWGKHFGKISLGWALIVLVGLAFVQGPSVSIHSLILVMFEQFLPFIFLLLSLFTITGGIKLKGQLAGSPIINTSILFVGAILASILGTTGAAVLLIRPLISANGWRKYKLHTILFFIFIVGNIGGTLTPLGNPPVLMGFISKIPFFWPTLNLFGPTALATVILLVMYFIVDIVLHKKETATPPPSSTSISFDGKWNFLLLIGVVAAVMVSSMDLGIAFTLHYVPMPMGTLVELIAFGIITYLSVRITSKAVRESNNFTWHPILEVGKIFAAIFVCMAPLIAMLRAGGDGPMSFIIQSLSSTDGTPINGMYYWLSGGLSAFLDSAPAYLVFFNTAAAPAAASGLAPHTFMLTVLPNTLIAITVGASFMGAISYIGNAPNMMIKAIAEENGIKMPSFFGYVGWAILVLVPVFLLIQYIFIS